MDIKLRYPIPMRTLLFLCSIAAVQYQSNAFKIGHENLAKNKLAFSTVTNSYHRHVTTKRSKSALASEKKKTSGIGSVIPFFASVYEKPKEKGTKTVTTRLPLGNLFDSREYIFECATNMRGYEWTLKEAEELLDDLVDASSIGRFGSASSGKEMDYELSQIVIVPMEWDQEKYGLGQKYDVHDGQQRLVTICLMLAALRESFRGDKDMEDTVTEVANMLNPTKVRKDDILRIQLRKRDNEMLTRILKAEMNDVDDASITKELRYAKSLSVANQHVLENYGQFISRMRSFTKDERLTLLDFLSMRVHMLVCVPDTPSIARNIVMSQGKGMDNEPIDDFKGLVCFRYTTNEKDMQETFDKWDKLAATPDVSNNIVGRDIISAACLHRATTVLRSKIGKNDHIFAFEGWLRQEIMQSEDKIDGKDFFKNHIEPASLALGRYRDLSSFSSFSERASSSKLGDMIGIRLAFLRALTSYITVTKELEMVILELLLRSTGKSGSGGKKRMALKEVDQYLANLERLAMWMALTKPPLSRRYQCCFDILNEIEENEEQNGDIDYSSLSEQEKADLREELVRFDFGLTPTGRKIATALLERLNSHILLQDGSEQMLSSNRESILHVEHILPVKATKKMWGDDWTDNKDKNFWLHRLGNLTLLSKKVSTVKARQGFASKKERYEKENWPLTNDVAKFEVWNRESLVKHMGSVLNLVDEIWGL